MKSLYYILIALGITGCSFSNPFVKHDYVDVPYPVSCVTWEPTKDVSNFDKLEDNSPIWEQVKTLLLDRERDKIYIEGQRAVIEGCK